MMSFYLKLWQGSASVSTPWNTTDMPEITKYIVVDSANTIQELNEFNNGATRH
jgi:hypothetical protein